MGHNPNVAKHTYDPAKAKQVLDAAGWVPGPDGIRAKGADKLSFELMNIAGEQERAQILSFIQRQWKEIGVDAKMKLVDVGTLFGQALPKREFDMAYSFIGRTADPEISSLYLSPELKPTEQLRGVLEPRGRQADAGPGPDGQPGESARMLLFKAQDIVADGRGDPVPGLADQPHRDEQADRRDTPVPGVHRDLERRRMAASS